MRRIALAGLMAWISSALLAQQPTPPVQSKLRGNELMNPATDDYTSTKLFGLEARGSKFVYVFDRSGSMGENRNLPLRRAKEELLASLNDLNERQQFYIVFYN